MGCQERVLKKKLNGHTNYVYSVKSIRLWDFKTQQQIQLADDYYKDILTQYKASLFQINPNLRDDIYSQNLTYPAYPNLIISQDLILQAQDALILEGEFVNYQGVDLKSLLKSKGSIFLEAKIEEQQKKK